MKGQIQDGQGSKRLLGINTRGAARVSVEPGDLPEVGELSRLRFYRALLGSTGADSGTTNQNQDGSVTAQEFYIESHADYDLYVCRAAIVIADSAVAHNAFGNVSALSNGWDLQIEEAGVTTKLIDAATTGGEVILQSGAFDGYGDGTLAWELSNWRATEDAQLVAMNLSSLIPGGIRIGRGTKDRLVSVVNDDLTGLTQFNVIAMGYRHYP